MSQGKGSKNNRIKDWDKYWNNHDSIFEFIRCDECGQVYKKKDKNKYMRLENRDWVCKGECNYN